ncbi:MAG: hypothetical protein U0Q47_08730 [Mycobacterium sp.]
MPPRTGKPPAGHYAPGRHKLNDDKRTLVNRIARTHRRIGRA